MKHFWLLLTALVAISPQLFAGGNDYAIGVLDGKSREAPITALELRELLGNDRENVFLLDPDSWCQEGTGSNSRRVDLLVCPWARNLSPRCIPSLERHFQQGGDLLTLGGPAFRDTLWRSGDQWLSAGDWKEALAETSSEKILFSFDRSQLEGWRNSRSSADSEATVKFVKGRQGKALGVSVAELKKWNTMVSPRLKKPFPAGHTITTLHARAGGQTRKLSLEWREADGSRWVAVFPVTNRWRRIVLRPDDFSYWSGGPEERRAGLRKVFNPQNAVQLTVGVSISPTGSGTGDHEYYVDRIATAPNPFPEARVAGPPPVGGLTSNFFYEVANPHRLIPVYKQTEQDAGKLPVPDRLASHVMAQDVVGPVSPSRQRWIPLIEARDRDGNWLGTAANMHLNFEGSFAGSVRTVFSVTDPAWYKDKAVHAAIQAAVDRMSQGLYVRDLHIGGDSNREDAVEYDVELANLSEMSKEVEVHVKPGPSAEADEVESQAHGSVRLAPEKYGKVTGRLACPQDSGVVRVSTGLFESDQLVDWFTKTVRLENGRMQEPRFLGFGAEWDPYYSSNEREWPHYSEVSDEDWRKIVDRIKFMRLPLVRMMMLVRWCYRPDGSFEWQSPPMQHLYRQLEVCERQGIDVILCDWGCESWTRAPGIKNLADPAYASAIGAYMDHLIREKEYSCIKYFVLVNEPNNEAKGGWERWKRGVQNVSAELDRRGLGDDVTFLGTDAAQGPMEWHARGVDELPNLLEGYDFHLYARGEMVRNGELGAYFHRRWDYSRRNDPAGPTKACILGEAGLMNGSASHNNDIDTYYYGLAIADYAVQAARAETSAICAWMLDDNSHLGFNWGMWSSSKKGLTLRPWFYTWSLLTRSFPPGSVIYRCQEPSDSVRILAARVPGEQENWSFCVVNRGAEPVVAPIDVLGKETVVCDRYVYSHHRRKTNEKGFPVPVSRRKIDLEGRLEIRCPGEAVVILTSLPGASR